ncbi:MAG TPA: hypothetical protein VE914_11095 [Candidatus Angelobacter sp.]|nr:hypothetical protein [Candidatus Angelobacter sp.]
MTPEETIAAAEEAAVDLALDAAPEELLAGVSDSEIGQAVLAELLAHELAASHRLMQRIAAAADAMLDWSKEVDGVEVAAGKPAGDSAAAGLAASRLAGVAGRLMEQVRLGLLALRRCRPEGAPEEDRWIALSWLDGRCSQEEVERRMAAAKAARAVNDPPPKARPLSAHAQYLRPIVDEAAAGLAAEAGVADFAVAAAAERGGGDFLARLFTYELGAIHDLMMRFTGGAGRALERAIASNEDPAVALQLAGVAARLGDSFRRGLLTLRHLEDGPDGKPGKFIGLVWGGPEATPAAAGSAPANDTLDPAAATPATAGHGVHRSDSRPAA